MIFRFLFDVLLLYGALVTFIYFYQRHMQYFPDKNDPGAPKDSGVAEMAVIHLPTADGLKLVAWWSPPKKPDGKVVVLFHGNAGNIAGRGIKARHFIDKGYGILLSEYRGFGGNPGRPTEPGLYNDGRAALKWLDDKGFKPGQFALYGESIGTGVAVQLATEVQPRYLILEAPFASAAQIAKMSYSFLPVDIMMHDRYDNIDKIRDVRSSLFILHGDEDPTIPIESGKKLFDAANHPKEFCTIAGGGHSDLYDHHAGHIITEWLDKQVQAEKKHEAATGR